MKITNNSGKYETKYRDSSYLLRLRIKKKSFAIACVFFLPLLFLLLAFVSEIDSLRFLIKFYHLLPTKRVKKTRLTSLDTLKKF